MRELLLDEVLSKDILPRVKLIPVGLAGRRSGYQHSCLVLADTEAKTLRWLDACTVNDGITLEREEALGILQDALASHDEAWKREAWRQWEGWGTEEGSIPHQQDDSSCALFVYRFSQALAAGAEAMDPVPRCLELRAQVAVEIVRFALAQLRAAPPPPGAAAGPIG